MTVSIIIAVKTWQKHLEECVAKCLELDYPDYEIIIALDAPFEKISFKDIYARYHKVNNIPITVIPTGEVSPAHKRDIALKKAQGEIIAFLDDDAYPQPQWLSNAIKHFNDAAVGAVGGPAVTPPEDSLMQKASGIVYASALVSSSYIYRYIPKNKREVDDFPSCNFIVRKTVIEQIGGFNTKFWPGEDTKLCLEITNKLGKKIIYDPSVLVYHHRRALFRAHLRQIANYALHRGYFAKRYPENSLKFAYFIPSIFVLFLAIGAFASFFIPETRVIYLICISLYALIVFFFSLKNDAYLWPLVFLGIIATHLAYGIYFVKGLLSLKLKEEA